LRKQRSSAKKIATGNLRRTKREGLKRTILLRQEAEGKDHTKALWLFWSAELLNPAALENHRDKGQSNFIQMIEKRARKATILLARNSVIGPKVT